MAKERRSFVSHTDIRRQIVIQWMFPALVLARHLGVAITQGHTLPSQLPRGAQVQIERFFTFALQGEKAGEPFLRANFALVQQLLLPETDVVARANRFRTMTKTLDKKWIFAFPATTHLEELQRFLLSLYDLGQHEVKAKITYATDSTTS